MANGPGSGALIAKVRVPDGRRTANPARVKALADSIREIGLLQPIIIDCHAMEDCHGDESVELVAGLHRLEACKLLGWKRIPAVDRSSVPTHVERKIHESRVESPEIGRLLNRLAEIDENLCRNELSVLDRSKAIADRKEIYEELHPETRPVTERGGPGRGNKTAATVADVSSSFVDDTAAKTGRSPRAVRLDAQIGENITPEAAEAVRGTPVENSTRALVEIAREKDPQKQVEKAKQKAESSRAPSSPKAAQPAQSQQPSPSATIVKQVIATVEGLTENQRIAFFTLLVERYPNWIKFAR